MNKKIYGLLSLFAFILATIGCLMYGALNTSGYLAKVSGDIVFLSNAGISKAQSTALTQAYLDYQEAHYPGIYEWTVGNSNNILIYLIILLIVLGLILGTLAFVSEPINRSDKPNPALKSNFKLYGVLSVISFSLAGLGWLVFTALNIIGYLGINSSNLIANTSPEISRHTAEAFTLAYLPYQAKNFPDLFDWTIGPYNNLPGFLSIFLLVVGIIWATLYFAKKRQARLYYLGNDKISASPVQVKS